MFNDNAIESMVWLVKSKTTLFSMCVLMYNHQEKNSNNAWSEEPQIPEQTKYNKMKQGPFGNICGFLENDCS